jgi:hypothetical protein
MARTQRSWLRLTKGCFQIDGVAPRQVALRLQGSDVLPEWISGMLENPQRHSALARQRQYVELSRVPRTMRAEHFLQNVVTPVCDMLSRAGDSHEPFKAAHRRMLSMKETLLDLQREQKKLHDDRRLAPGSGLPARPVAQVITLSPRDSRGR